jgi:DNA-binding PadR family transcriptional regulator
VLEIAVLGLLKEQDLHGYELKKRLSDVFGLASAVSFGSLYPALSRLEAAGAIHVIGAEDVEATAGAGTDGPGSGSTGSGGAGLAGPERRPSRRRKVYGITAHGAEMFEELLASSQSAGEDERSFNLRLAFAGYLPPEARLGLLERRRAVLGERLAQLAARARARRDDRYMRVLAERQQEALSRDVSWLDGLIQEERTSAAGLRPAEAPGASDGTGTVPGGVPITRPARPVPLASASQLQRSGPGSLAPGSLAPASLPPVPLPPASLAPASLAPAATETNRPGPVNAPTYKGQS